MRRWHLLLLASVLAAATSAAPIAAQQVQQSRFTPAIPLITDTVPATGRQPLPPGFATQQAAVGLLGFTVGALAGGFVGAGAAPSDGGGFEDLAGVLVGMAVGGALGSSITVYRYSNGKGYRSSYPATLAGSVVGFLGGPLLWVTVPIGSAVGYNMARK